MENKTALKSTEELLQFIGFKVGNEEYGLELLRVKEVIRLREITWLPKAPAFVKGIINLRGDVIPIVDLRKRFGLQSVDETSQTRVIVVEVAGRLIGLVVDSASQVARLSSDQIEPPPLAVGSVAQSFVSGVGKMDDSLVILLNPDELLTTDEKEALSEIEAEAGVTEPVPASRA